MKAHIPHSLTPPILRGGSSWFYQPFRLGFWIVSPGPRMWWRLFTYSRRTALSSLVAPSLGTLLTAVTARLLGSEEYGGLATVATFVGWFNILAAFPAAGLVPNLIATGTHAQQPYERRCAAALLLTIVLGVAAAGIAIILTPLGLRLYQIEHLRAVAYLLCLGFIFTPPAIFALLILQATGRLKAWALLNVIFYVVLITCVGVAALVVRPFSMRAYAIALTISGTINTLTGLVIDVRILGWRNLVRPDFSIVPRVIREGWGGWVAVVCNVLAAVGVSTMIIKQVGRTELGYYQLVATVGVWVTTVIGSVSVPALSAWSTTAARGSYRRLMRELRMRQLATTSLHILAAVIALVFGREILHALYGEMADHCMTLLYMSTIYWIAVGFACWYWIALTAMGHPGMVMIPNVIWAIIFPGVTWILCRTTDMGAASAMAGQAVAHIAWAAAYEVIFWRLMHKKWRESLDAAQPPQ